MTPLLVLLAGVVVVVGGILVLRLHAFLALLLGAVVVAAATPRAQLVRYAEDQKMSAKAAEAFAAQPWGKRIAAGFGSTCTNIGIVIAMAAIIGQCMLESGAADRVVRSTIGVLGERGAPIAFALAGFLLGIPVFFDTVFYLMIPLGKALAVRTGKDYGLYVMTIAAGATISHSLVPPTPGPLYVATELGVMGPMILAGILIGGLSVIPGVAYAYYSNRRWPVPLRDTADASIEDLKASASKDDASLPPLLLSLVPILLPVVLIVGDVWVSQTLGKTPVVKRTRGEQALVKASTHLGDPNVALTIAAAVALGLMLRTRKPGLAKSVETSLASAGQIILITAAGGSFGKMLEQTGIGLVIKEMFAGGAQGSLVLVAAFLVTALVRVAQGGATVAMVTAMGIFAGLAKTGGLGFHPVYLALAIGFGSKPVPWMNDSGFWVVCKMSGQTVQETLRNHTVVFTIMGVSGLVFTLIAAKLFPFVP